MKTNYLNQKWLFEGKWLVFFTFIFMGSSSFGQTVADFEIVGSVCCGSSLDDLVLTNKSTVDSGDLTFEWSFTYLNGVNIGDDSLLCDSTYSVKLMATSASRGSDSMIRNFRVEKEVDAQFTYRREGRTVYFFGPEGNDWYRWTFGDGARDITENPAYTYLNNEGIVVCLATQKGACRNQSCDSSVFRIFWGIDENGLISESISTVPNPTNGELTVSLSNDQRIESIEVIDLVGSIVLSQEYTSKQNAINLNLTEQKQGVYFMRVSSDGNTGTKRIVIAR
jgi:hypothetical protein